MACARFCNTIQKFYMLCTFAANRAAARWWCATAACHDRPAGGGHWGPRGRLPQEGNLQENLLVLRTTATHAPARTMQRSAMG